MTTRESLFETERLHLCPRGLGDTDARLAMGRESGVSRVLLIPEDAVGPAIEIGWRLPPQAWGQGIATEAARPILHYAFARLKLTEVIAEIDAANAAARRVATKLGFVAQPVREAAGRRLLRYRRVSQKPTIRPQASSSEASSVA
jgi:RimJ/RimL family protein N-acetyltransferase